MTELEWTEVIKIIMETKPDNSKISGIQMQTETQNEYTQRVRIAIAKELYIRFKEIT